MTPTGPDGGGPVGAVVGDGGLSAQESLTLIALQHREVRGRLAVNPVLIFGLWGVAGLLGYGALYLANPGAGAVVPGWVAGWVLGVLVVIACVVPGVKGARAGRGILGSSRRVGALYGWSWTLGFAALGGINAGLQRHGLGGDAVTLLWSGGSLLVIGLLYLAGGTLWRDRSWYALGVWMLLAAGGSVFAGVPGNYLVLSVAGGGGLLVTAAYQAVWGSPRALAGQG